MKPTMIEAALPGFDTEVGRALWRLEDARARTLTVLGKVPADALDTPHGAGNTIGSVVYHVALIEADWLYSEVKVEDVPEDVAAFFPVDARDEKGILSHVSGMTMEDHVRRLAFVRARLLDCFREIDAADFHRARVLDDYDVSPAWVLHHLAQHEAEHRSEIAALAMDRHNTATAGQPYLGPPPGG